MSNPRTLGELVEAYQNANQLWHFEGDSGIANLENIIGVIGYTGHGFQYGSPVEQFLADNPGAIEALLEWVKEQKLTEWTEAFEAEVPEEAVAD